MCKAMCEDGRTVRRIPSKTMYKFHVEETGDYFSSIYSTPVEAYNDYLTWVSTYYTPDGFTIRRLFDLSDDGSWPEEKYEIDETGEMFSARINKNIYKAYMERKWCNGEIDMEIDDIYVNSVKA